MIIADSGLVQVPDAGVAPLRPSQPSWLGPTGKDAALQALLDAAQPPVATINDTILPPVLDPKSAACQSWHDHFIRGPLPKPSLATGYRREWGDDRTGLAGAQTTCGSEDEEMEREREGAGAHVHEGGQKRDADADDIVSPHMGASYSPEHNKRVVEH